MSDDRDDENEPERRPNGTMMPGHTANRRGRPKRSRNMLTIFNEKRDELVMIKLGDQTRKMTRLEAWVTNLWNRALSLDPKASQTVMAILRASGQLDPSPAQESDLNEGDAAALAALLARLPKPQGGNGDE